MGFIMPRQSGQKKKLLLILQILTQETDINHPITRKQLEERLANQGIKAERKSIYDDINELVLFGYDIIQKKDEPKGYYMGSREFEIAELKLLVDAVASSKFMTEKKSNDLIKKLENLASHNEAKALQRHVVVKRRVKTENEGIFYNVDTIHEAINQNRKVSFIYVKWNLKKELEERKNGERYEVSPYDLIWDDENYYLLAFDSEAGIMKHYRVDKMRNLEISEIEREGQKEYKKINIADYTKSIFSMYRGEEEKVRVWFKNNLVGVVIDRFGKDIPILAGDDEHFISRVSVELSPQFFAWIAAFEGDAWIEEPESAAEAYKEFLQNAMKCYEK